MSTPKRHHYVPQLLLNNFTDQDDWLHWCFTSGNDRNPKKARPKEVFAEGHLYSTLSVDGSKDPRIETEFLREMESKAKPVLEHIIEHARSGNVPSLSIAQREIWSVFLLTQWRRTPDRQKSLFTEAEAMAVLEQVIETAVAEAPHRRQEAEQNLTDDVKRLILRNTRIDALALFHPKTLTAISDRGVTVLRIPRGNRAFIIGSNPVVKLTSEGNTDIRRDIAQMWLPIASDVAVGLGPGRREVTLVDLASDRQIRQLNDAIARQSSAIAGRSPLLISSVTNRR